MNRISTLLLPLALLAPACTTTGIPTSPAAIANATKLDEQGGLAITSAYRAAIAAARLRNQLKPFTAAEKAKATELESKAFAAVAAVRTAYESANQASYTAAMAKARPLIDAITTLAE